MSRSLLAILHERYGEPPDARTRRQMLQDSLAAAAGLLLSESQVCTASATPKRAGKRVLVIGAGLAGLAASYELASVGYDVAVVEARARLGGRVVSFADLVAGKNVEGGGEFVGSNHPTWLTYAKRFRLKFWDVTQDRRSEMPVILEGKRLTAIESRKLWREMELTLPRMNAAAAKVDGEEPWKSPNAVELDQRTAATWLASLKVSDLCRLGLRVYFTSDSGVDPAWQSYLGLLAHVKGGGLEKFWTESEVYRCAGGNQQLAQKLAEAIGNERVLLGTPAIAVAAGSKSMLVTLVNGKKMEVDDVVLATPPSTWQRIAFDPPLPAKLVPRMATHIKFLAAIKSRFWKSAKLSPESLTDGPVSLTWEATDGQASDEGACLTVFAGSNAADIGREWDPKERTEKYLGALEALYPEIRNQFQSGRFLNWPSDPWTKASYSCPGPGEVTAMGPILHQGIGHLHFAGEHTSYAFGGYMEGALQSGVREARKLAKRDGVVNG